MSTVEELIEFRQSLYALFPKRQAAIMNLLDALTSEGRQCRSVIQLSQSPYFKRQYSSITDAIADGLPAVNWQEIQQLVYSSAETVKPDKPHLFVGDCTGNLRQFSKKLYPFTW